jgi:hypothetical protein
VSAEFRPSTPADAAEIAALCRRVLAVPAGSPAFAAELMQWKYWTSWPDWPGSRSYVLTRDGRVVAHGAVWPLLFDRGGRRFTLLNFFDWAAEPTALGSGAALVKRLAALADGMVVAGGSDITRRMARPLGFRRFGERIAYARPAAARPEPELGDHSVERMDLIPDAECPRRDSPASGQLEFHRSAAALRELLRCPVAPMEYHVVSRSGSRIGSFLLAHAPAQMRIAGLWPDSDEAGDLRALVELAARQAALRPDVAEVAYLSTTSREALALAGAGFRACGTEPLSILVAPEVIADPTSIRFQMIDSDAAFLHHGAPVRWNPE